MGGCGVGRDEGNVVMYYELCKLHIPAQHFLWEHLLVLQGPLSALCSLSRVAVLQSFSSKIG